MRFFTDNKIYDTDKAELLCTGERKWLINFLGRNVLKSYETQLYKTAKGNFFFVRKGDYDSHVMSIAVEREVKNFLIKNKYEKYAELYGELEEA